MNKLQQIGIVIIFTFTLHFLVLSMQIYEYDKITQKKIDKIIEQLKREV